MSLMKWMRKNNKKLMAIVVIVLMVAFIGGSSFSFLMRGSGGVNKAVAYYGGKQKISHADRMEADAELKLLEDLGVVALLQRQDLRGLLLAELLFPQSRDSAGMLEAAREAIQRNQYHISDAQLVAMYKDRTVPSDLYWILLREEAQSAGIHVSNQQVGELLGRIVPQLFGATYTQMMKVWVNRSAMPEDRILATYGKLLAVLQYAQVISSMESLTSSQIRHIANNEAETLSAEYVQFDASAFADNQQTPSNEALLEHFDKYKASFAGDVNEANPFGFGYRLPARVRLDYIALKLSDVAGIVKTPTVEDTETYYQQNREREFTEKVPTDPNDPNSPQVDKVKSYVEVVDDIARQLTRQRILMKAEQILVDARNLADSGVSAAGADGNEPTTSERRVRATKPEHNYARIAQDLSARHNVPLHSGRTGMLSAADVRSDSYLRRMSLVSYGRNPIPLSQAIFSVEELANDATILFTTSPAKMFLTLGPARDPLVDSAKDISKHIMVIVRVVAAEPSAAPASLDDSYSTRALNLGEAADAEDKTVVVTDQVVKDLQALAAWDTTRAKAEEFLALATQDGWDKAVTEFNKLYGEQAKADPNDPNVFRMDRRMNIQRISQADIQTLTAQLSNSAGASSYLREANKESELANRLFSLVPSVAQAPQILEFKPGRCYYAIKSLTPRPLYQEQFQKMKGMAINREEYGQTQSLAVVHLNPQNILKRAGFRFVDQKDQPDGKETKKESKGTS
ncbi:MAG TPA: hypothetical protein PKH24_08630 [Sedimentisphaerales bacterium]|jgi:hypothetical protein|nr:hypothetical protein [Sedimentisphaerales bacterium]HNU28830.1 hypothetical protein [Sedimentisphaerales bacterium]